MTKKRRRKRQAVYRKIHVPDSSRNCKNLVVMGTRTVDGERIKLATVKVMPDNNYQVQLIVQNLCRLSLFNLKKAVYKYASSHRQTIHLDVLRFGLDGGAT